MTETTQQQPTTAEPARAPEGHKAITSTQRVFDAVRDLREVDQIATRETVAELTGLKMSVVDDRLRALVDDNKLKRLLRGVYELVETFPEPRPIYCGILHSGMVKMEVGETVLTLTPSEARRAARALGGFADDARVIESTRSHLFLATELAAKVESQGRELKTMRELLRGKLDARQMDLLGVSGPEDAKFREGAKA
ncbi:MAG: hypothetical protein RL244_1380 [Pseudomonadota bacterium]|jgi:ribosomal protein S25